MQRAATTAITAALMLTSVYAQTSTTHRTTTGAARRRAAATTAQTSTEPQEGVAAIGSMPAATGPVKTLFALRYIELRPGTGELAQTHKYYTVHYTGWTTDGKKFGSSFDHDPKEPIVFPVGAHRVIFGWDAGFAGMHVGGKRRIIVPYQLAYGEAGRPPVIPEKADLIFDVELLAQSDTPPQQPEPPAAQPATPPPAAQKPAAQPPAASPKDPTKPTATPE